MKIPENPIFQSPTSSFLRSVAKLAVTVCASLAIIMAAGTASASAATIPYHNYSYGCSRGVVYLPGDSRPYYLIKIMPQQIDTDPMVGKSIIYGDGTSSPTYHQYTYFWLWVWTKTASGWQWQHTAAKRVFDGWPVNYAMEAWDRKVGAWMNSSLGDFYNPTIYDPNNPSNVSDMLVFGYELGMYVPADIGVRTWTFTVETYWAPPFTGSGPSPYDPRIPSGGLDSFERTSSGSWFSVACSS